MSSLLKLTKTGEEARVDHMGEGVFAFTQGKETVVLHVEDLRNIVTAYTKSPGKLVAQG